MSEWVKREHCRHTHTLSLAKLNVRSPRVFTRWAANAVPRDWCEEHPFRIARKVPWRFANRNLCFTQLPLFVFSCAVNASVVARRTHHTGVILVALHRHWSCAPVEEARIAHRARVHLRRRGETNLPLRVSFAHALCIVPHVFENFENTAVAVHTFLWTRAAFDARAERVDRGVRPIRARQTLRDGVADPLLHALVAAAQNSVHVEKTAVAVHPAKSVL